ncbi:uncharacterized protein TRIADDRAFT_60197 [Trichoplax adhaerens]|uniref:Uncharacterized protein n=1 Tax=Trichoplax adhaerens TaxID=10228 RepID=B3S7K3_TRIAD|nr:hypothetical protein TRIADDRAFT_60197 [Trichoplax adhaerens]EDV21306.1 hypothetical protein TRIADDRAFT_60197 [Trichoplax adhaerens]|eukprot:XP_002116273.1 hypothetical protein TRIADDRAFT_60197 [Trichoplax adhaerens]
MAEGDLKESTIAVVAPDQKPINLQSSILQKKKSNFEITSIRSTKSEIVNISVVDDELEDSEVYDNNDSTLTINDNALLPIEEQQEKVEATTNGHNVPPTSRFRVIIDVRNKTFKRGRWNCRDYLERRQEIIKSDAGSDTTVDDGINNLDESNNKHQQQPSQQRQPQQPSITLPSPVVPQPSQNINNTDDIQQQPVNPSIPDADLIVPNDTMQQNALQYTDQTLRELNEVGSSVQVQAQHSQPTMQQLDQLPQNESQQQPIVQENEILTVIGNANIPNDTNNIVESNEDVSVYVNNDVTNVNNTVSQASGISNSGSDVMTNIGIEGIQEEELNDMVLNQISPTESNATTNTTSTENFGYPNMSQAVDSNYTPILTENGAPINNAPTSNITGNYLPPPLQENNFPVGNLSNPTQSIQDNQFSTGVANSAILGPQHSFQHNECNEMTNRFMDGITDMLRREVHRHCSHLIHSNAKLEEENAQLHRLEEENAQLHGLKEENAQLYRLKEENTQLHRLKEENAQLHLLMEENAHLKQEIERLKAILQQSVPK